KHEYAVGPATSRGRPRALEEPGREERARIQLPADVDYQAVPEDRTLSEMLAAGDLDGLISARAPSCFLRGDAHVGRLFPDYPKIEEEYFRKTHIFPITHA